MGEGINKYFVSHLEFIYFLSEIFGTIIIVAPTHFIDVPSGISIPVKGTKKSGALIIAKKRIEMRQMAEPPLHANQSCFVKYAQFLQRTKIFQGEIKKMPFRPHFYITKETFPPHRV